MGWAAAIPIALTAIQMLTQKPEGPPPAPQLGGQGGSGGYQPTAANAPSGSVGPPVSARGAEDASMAAMGGGMTPPPLSARGAEDMSMQRFAQAMPQAGQAAAQMPKMDTSPQTMTPSSDTMGQVNNYLQMGMMARDLMSNNTPAPPPPQLGLGAPAGGGYNPTARRFRQAMG